MQLRLQRKFNRNLATKKLVIKTILFVLVFFLVIFLLDRIEITPSNEIIKQEIGNDKLITVK